MKYIGVTVVMIFIFYINSIKPKSLPDISNNTLQLSSNQSLKDRNNSDSHDNFIDFEQHSKNPIDLNTSDSSRNIFEINDELNVSSSGASIVQTSINESEKSVTTESSNSLTDERSIVEDSSTPAPYRPDENKKEQEKLRLIFKLRLVIELSDIEAVQECLNRSNISDKNRSKQVENGHVFELTKFSNIVLDGNNISNVLLGYSSDLLSDNDLKNYLLNMLETSREKFDSTKLKEKSVSIERNFKNEVTDRNRMSVTSKERSSNEEEAGIRDGFDNAPISKNGSNDIPELKNVSNMMNIKGVNLESTKGKAKGTNLDMHEGCSKNARINSSVTEPGNTESNKDSRIIHVLQGRNLGKDILYRSNNKNTTLEDENMIHIDLRRNITSKNSLTNHHSKLDHSSRYNGSDIFRFDGNDMNHSHRLEEINSNNFAQSSFKVNWNLSGTIQSSEGYLNLTEEVKNVSILPHLDGNDSLLQTKDYKLDSKDDHFMNGVDSSISEPMRVKMRVAHNPSLSELSKSLSHQKSRISSFNKGEVRNKSAYLRSMNISIAPLDGNESLLHTTDPQLDPIFQTNLINIINSTSPDKVQRKVRVADTPSMVKSLNGSSLSQQTNSTLSPTLKTHLNGEEVQHESALSSSANSSFSALWPVKMAAEMSGELILGGLMMVHEREETITCGPIMPEGGVQALEVMLYTLDVLNTRPESKFKLGAHVLDDCDKDTYGLEMAVDFIKGSISNIDDSELHCNKTQIRKVISGVVGAASSVTSIQVANLLRLFKIPQVSFMSTSPELSNKQRFEYFTRTIPSDHYQVKAMVEIIRKLRWNYVSVIYEESNYGIKAFEELEALLSKHNICIAVKEKLVKDSGVAEDAAYDSIVQKLQTKPRARGAIVYGSDQEVAGLMRAVRRRNATGAFSWIGSDGWSGRSLVTQSNEHQVEGTLSLQPQANPVKGFDTYFLNLTVDNNKRNPWFVEFWEDHFQCRYPNSSLTPYNSKYTRMCTTQERLTRQNTVFENQLQFVSDAVMALAEALNDMHKDLCGGKPGLCDAMRPTQGSELLKYLRTVTFTGLSGDKFHFDENGDGPARYNIIHFKQISPGNFQWVNVGQYINGELQLDMPAIQFKLGEPDLPESVCSLPCEVGQAKTYVEGESCCWHCLNCSQYQIRDPLDETLCKLCAYGTVPDVWHQTCLDLPEDFLRAESGWAIGAMSLSFSGVLITLFVIGVFLRHNETPVVKASGRELSYVLLTGILLCYLITFVFVLKPTDVVCGVQRFGAGFCFTVVYAALLTKTNRISRIFNAGKRTAKRPNFITPKSQLIICSVLVSVQLFINAVWMLLSPPKAIHHYPTRDDNMLICSSYVDASYMIAFGYPIVLIIICTVYAVLTRNIPEAFNESKHIGFTMYTTCVIWLAFVPLYFGTGGHMPLRITSMAVTISLSASVTIACLFSPKLYIIMIRPEQNIRQSMMPNSRHGGTMRTTTAVASVRVGSAPLAGQTKTMSSKCPSSENNMDSKEMNNDLKVKSFMSRSTQTLNTIVDSQENTTQTVNECDAPASASIEPANIDATVSLPTLHSAERIPANMLNSKTYRSTGDSLMKDNCTAADDGATAKVHSPSSSASHKSRNRRRRGERDNDKGENKEKNGVKNGKSNNALSQSMPAMSNGPAKL